jgi:hypothetical protein
MPRFTSLAVLGWILAGTLHPAAQQPRLQLGMRDAALSRIHGNALSSTNTSLPNALVRLRDARFGRSVDTQTADHSGLFAFRPVDPGNYVVEILGQDKYSTLAASQVLTVEAGQVVSAVVKLPFNMSPLVGVLGAAPASATGMAAQSALAGVLTMTPSGVGTCDTLQ